jgi:hypothetical protein
MLINVSPEETSIDETINSSRFATTLNECHLGTAKKIVKHHVRTTYNPPPPKKKCTNCSKKSSAYLIIIHVHHFRQHPVRLHKHCPSRGWFFPFSTIVVI